MNSYQDIITAMFNESETPAAINSAICAVTKMSAIEDKEPNLHPDGVFVWTLPNGNKVKEFGGEFPDFAGQMDVAVSLIPQGRKWSLTSTPATGCFCTIIANPNHEGPGYESGRWPTVPLAITFAALVARQGLDI